MSNPSYNVIHSGEICWWSQLVKNECFGENGISGVCGKESFCAKKEFRKIISEFDREIYSLSSLDNYPIIGEIIRNYAVSTGCTKDILCEWIKQYKRDFIKICNARQQYINKNLKLHTRVNEYPAVRRQIIDNILSEQIELDESDVDIWIDAHDLAEMKKADDVVFVSDNTKHAAAAAHIIVYYTKIKEVRELERFRTDDFIHKY